MHQHPENPETKRQPISLFTSTCLARTARQAVAGVLAVAMLPLSAPGALAQGYGAPQPPDYEGQGAYQPLAPEQIDSLVAPIALYPDTLVAQVLAAATYPAQVASAEQFVQENAGYPPEQLGELANTQPWDPSVKSLVAFPQVLNDLNRNMDWTTQLGNAYYNQPQDVLGAVQTMRQRAYAAGNLRSGPQLAVQYDPGDIVIAPVTPTVIYVPYYNPWVVYGAPVPVYPDYYYGPPRGVGFGTGLAIGFGVGVAVAAFTNFSWGCHSWHPDWHDRTVVYNHNTYISNSVTVINHGNYGHFDRNPEARAFNHEQAARFSPVNNRTTINNVTVNRGGNTYNNRDGNTFNRGGNTYHRGPQGPGNGAWTHSIQGTTAGPDVHRGDTRFGNMAVRAPYSGAPTAPVRPGGNFGQPGIGPGRVQGGYRSQVGAPVPQGGNYGQMQGGPVRPGGGFGSQQPVPVRTGGTFGQGQAGPVRPQSGFGGLQGATPMRPGGGYGQMQAGPVRPQGGFGSQQPAPMRPQGNFGQMRGGLMRPQGEFNHGGGAQPAPRPDPQMQEHGAPGGGGHEYHGGGDHHH